jgi:6-phosphogluconolactonase
MRGSLHVYQDPPALAAGAARFIANLLVEAIRDRGRTTLVLSGGSTPRIVYERLGSSEFSGSVEWDKVHFFWGDERFVPHSAPESNFLMAKRALLDRVISVDDNVHRIMTNRDPVEAAAQYEKEITRFFILGEKELPIFDVVLLGLGEDGHTASLFPESSLLNEREALVGVATSTAFPHQRLTMTLPVMNHARHVLFLVTGMAKASILHKVLEGEAGQYPAMLVSPVSGDLHWFADRDAASFVRAKVQA